MLFNKNVLFIVLLPMLFVIFTACGKKSSTNLSTATSDQKFIILKIGHVGHDHHLPLFVALDLAEKNPAKFCPKGIRVKKSVDKKRYELLKNGIKIAELKIVTVGGGSKMPTSLSQYVIDVGLGGIAPVLAAIDKGAPLKVISPLHAKGDMFVLQPQFSADTWTEFIKFAKTVKKPIRIGYKNPIAVAKIIFENALKHEGVKFSTDITDSQVKIHMINVKGGGKLNVSLANGIIDGYVGNNPFPAIGEDKKLLKIICELDNLPPGDFKDHPCCCIAASRDAVKSKSGIIKIVLFMMRSAVDYINSEPEKVAKIASRWIGTSKSVEIKSIASSEYSMDNSQQWHKTMSVWNDAMNRLGFFDTKLKNLSETDMGEKAYDFSLLENTAK